MTTSPLEPASAAPLDPGEALLAAVREALPDLEALHAHADVLGDDAARALAEALACARERLGREELRVVVVGEQKSGKSTFLNALLGERLLGTAARECTATVTRIRHAAKIDYLARFEDGHEERFSERLPDPAPVLAAAVAVLERAREQLDRGHQPLHELPATHPLEPALPDGMHEALVDAYRALAGAAADRDAARETIPRAYREGGAFFKRVTSFLAWRKAKGAIARAELCHDEAARSVCQAQRYLVERRIAALADVAVQGATARRERFAAEVRDLTDLAGRGRDVAFLELDFPGQHLPPGLTLLDTPGVNTDNELHRERAWRVIREEADGIWLASDLQQALSRSTRDFLQAARPYVAHAFLILTKVDRALANATGVGDEDPREQVEEARRQGVKRFARELDRSPREVFAVAVAAQMALDEPASALAVGFAEAIATLIALARQERAIVLGARAAGAVRQAIQGIETAGEHARAAYEERLAILDAQRIPAPEAFKAQQLALVRPRLGAGLRPVVANAVLEAKKALARQQTAWHMALLTAMDEDALKATVTRIGGAEASTLAEIAEEAIAHLRAGGAAVLTELEADAFEALRARYRLAKAAAGPTLALVPLAAQPESVEVDVAAGLDEAVLSFQVDRVQLGVGGAAAGAALGSLVLPGLGTLVGSLVGSLAAFFVRLDDLKADCIKQLEARVAATEPRLARVVEEAGVAIEASLADTLDRGLATAVARYQSWIDDALARQRAAVEGLQDRLADLQTRQAALATHAARLAECVQAAEEASRGLARSPADDRGGATVRLNLRRRGAG